MSAPPVNLGAASSRLLRQPKTAWLVLAIGLLGTVGGWWLSRSRVEDRERARFDMLVERATNAISARMFECELVLRGAQGLFAASKSVERGEWRAYVGGLDFEKHLPGTLGFGFAAYVPHAKLDSFLTVTRNDEATNFVLHPAGERPDYFVIKYLEPVARNPAALGFDLGTEPVLRAAANQARDSAQPTLTGRTTLVGDDRQRAGFRLLLPVYRNGVPHQTVAERQSALEGWVYAAFRADELMQGILADSLKDFDLAVHDGETPSPEHLLYANEDGGTASRRRWLSFASATRLPVAGRIWTLSFATRPAFDAAIDRSQPRLIMGAGLCITVLLFGITRSLATTRERALALAEEMTAQLRQQKDFLATLIQHLPVAIFVKNAKKDLSFELWNPKACDMFGFSEKQVIGKRDNDLHAREDAERFRQHDLETIRAGHVVEIHDELFDSPTLGRLRLHTLKVPIPDQDGSPAWLLGISENITERKRAEAALHEAKETAEKANSSKSEFLANMSHELRTPLNSVIGFANILLKNKAKNLRAEDITFLERITANGKHLLGLINQILDLSKIEAGKLELDVAPVSLEALVREIIDQFEGQLRGRDVKLLADLPQPLAVLETDAIKLKQVLINLVGNALKFTEHGSVTVRVSVKAPNQRPVRIDVIDTGIGILREKQAAVFEAFQQADNTTARKYGGTGLGLTISRALCQLMGCRLEVSSEEGRGTTFSVILPVAKESTARAHEIHESGASAAAPAPILSPSGSDAEIKRLKEKLVLVIDDEADSRILLTHLVEECGCRVITADSGEQALRRAKEVRPDLIMLDLVMPQMDGWQVLKMIKADPQLRGIPVVVASIVARDHQGTLLGAVDTLQKPVSREDLQRVLKLCARPKVLVVEDNEMDRRLLVASLEAEGAEVRAAAHGRAALEWLESFSPDLILLDLLMPEMDGLTFLDQLRKDPCYVHLPVFIVTAKDLTAEEKRRIGAQAQAVLKKADDLGADLLRMLREHPAIKPQSHPL